jgi:hypothetical protein
MKSTVITCDVCGQIKGETNHWFIALTNAGHHEVGIGFGPADCDHQTDTTIREDICGQECLRKRLSQWLELTSKKGATE